MPRHLLLPLLVALAMISPAPAAPKTVPASKHSKRKPANVGARSQLPGHDWAAEAAAYRLLHKSERVTQHPEKATQAQLAQAARDLVQANELAPGFELQPWYHAYLGTVLYAQAKATRGRDRRHLLEKASVQFGLAALTHDLDADRTDPRDVTDYTAAGDATASFILYHVGLINYELGDALRALVALDLLLDAAADHELERPEYVQEARALLPKVKQANEKQLEEELAK
jgi:hypothetical protein